MTTWRYGIDIGHRAVKVLGIARGERLEAVAALVPIAAAAEGEPTRQAQLAALRTAIEQAGIPRRSSVAVAFPTTDAILRVETIPDMPEEEAQSFARLRALADLPFEPEEVMLAQAISERRPDGTRKVEIALARREKIEALLALVREADLVPISLEVATDALRRALRNAIPPAHPELVEGERNLAAGTVLVLDVGATTTSLLLLCDGMPALARGAPIGTVTSGDEVVKAVITLVERSLRAARQEVPSRVVLAGFGALHADLAAELGRALGVLVTLCDATASLPLPAATAPSPLFAVARGLAEESPFGAKLDFLGERESRRAAVTRNRRVRIGSFAGAALVLVVAIAWIALAVREANVRALNARVQELLPVVTEVRRLASERNQALSWRDKKGAELAVLGAFVAALPERLYLTRFEWQDGRAVRIAGRAADAELVGTYLADLERTPLVESASFDQITRMTRQGPGSADGVDFAITAQLAGGVGGAR